jgi:hypothetical protein
MVREVLLIILGMFICWNFWVVSVLVQCLNGNQRQTQAAKVRKVLFAEKRKERLHEVMQQDPETSGLLSQVENQIL